MKKFLAVLVVFVLASTLALKVVRGADVSVIYTMYTYNVTPELNKASEDVANGANLPLFFSKAGNGDRLDFIGQLTKVTQAVEFEGGTSIIMQGTLDLSKPNKHIERLLDSSSAPRNAVVSVNFVVELYYSETEGLFGVIRNMTKVESYNEPLVDKEELKGSS